MYYYTPAKVCGQTEAFITDMYRTDGLHIFYCEVNSGSESYNKALYIDTLIAAVSTTLGTQKANCSMVVRGV